MKTKKLLIIAMLVLFYFNAALAQNTDAERTSRLKIGLITPSIAYEHAFKKNFSLELGLFANPFYVSSLSDQIQFTYSLNLEVRKYLFSKESLNGFYLAGSFENYYLPKISNPKKEDFTYNKYNFFAGTKLGYQKVFNNGLFINTALGYGTYGDFKSKSTMGATLDFTFGFTIQSKKLRKRKKELEKLNQLK